MIPYWAKDPKVAYRTINARVESVDTAPSYREAFKRRRCLIPADGFYEWKKVLGGKIPYSIGMKDDSPFVFAGLWEGWKDPTTDEWLRTCTIMIRERTKLGLARARLEGRVGGKRASLTPKQQALALKMVNEGKSQSEVAELFRVHRSTICRVVSDRRVLEHH